MGYGDYLHWTSVIRDLYNEINNINNINEKILSIEKFIKIFKNHKHYGIYKYKNKDNEKNFKINLNQSNKYIDSIFKNNPYITHDNNYPNIIYFKIVSSAYQTKNGFIDDKHVIETYCNKIGLKNFKIKCDLFFTDREKNKVEKYIPKKDFIFVEPNNFKIGRQYPINKFQNIVNSLKDKIDFIQISPKKHGCSWAQILKNVKAHIGIFTFREVVYFMKFAKCCLMNHGGLSIASNVTEAKSIAIFTACFNSKMTKYSNLTAVQIDSKEHFSCGILKSLRNWKQKNPNKLGCPKCNDLMINHDENTIIKLINNILDVNYNNE